MLLNLQREEILQMMSYSSQPWLGEEPAMWAKRIVQGSRSAELVFGSDSALALLKPRSFLTNVLQLKLCSCRCDKAAVAMATAA